MLLNIRVANVYSMRLNVIKPTLYGSWISGEPAARQIPASTKG